MIFDQQSLSPDKMEMLASKFEADDRIYSQRGNLHVMVLNGVSQFVIAGHTEPQYACWFSVQLDKMFHAQAVLSLSPKNKPADLFNLADRMAMNLGCRGVIFETRHPGLVRQSQKQGYCQRAVVMEKVF